MVSNCPTLSRQPEFSVFDRSKRLLNLGLILLSLTLMSGTIFYIHTQVSAVDLGYKIDEALKQKQVLEEENKGLRLQIAQLKSPTRIEKVAKEKLSMDLPQAHQRVYLSQWPEGQLVINFNDHAKPASPSVQINKTKLAKQETTKEIDRPELLISQKLGIDVAKLRGLIDRRDNTRVLLSE